MTTPALSVVMPVHNEGEAVEHVLADWISTLDSLRVPYELIVLDDGSTDATSEVLAEVAAGSPAVRLLRHANVGHGPTVLRGYALTRGDWVLQIDSDGEILPGRFPSLWSRRDDYDLLIGRRMHRVMPPVRRGVSAVSRLTVRLLFGQGIHDVNVPYRLIRGPLLRELISALPGGLFAPNVIISGLAVRRGLRILEVPVEHVRRRHGRSSLRRLRVLGPAALSLWQTLLASRRCRAAPRRRRPS